MLFCYGLFSWLVVVTIGVIVWAIMHGNPFYLYAYAMGAGVGIYFVILANRKTFRDASK